MSRRTVFFVFFGCAFLWSQAAFSAKVQICHIPPDDPQNFHTILVSEKAALKHIEKHGDLEGPCENHCGELCDDGNPCTIDECLSNKGGCLNTPADVGTSCGEPVSGVCDSADTCDEKGTCLSNFAPSTTECREASGECDVAEYCTGITTACPADGPNLTTECRASLGSCDIAEYCSDESDDCPADTVLNVRAYYEDADRDGYGNPDVIMYACEAPEFYTEDNSDCDDNHAWFWLEDENGDCSLKAYTDCAYIERYSKTCHPPLENEDTDHPVYTAHSEFDSDQEGYKWEKDKFGYLTGQVQPGFPYSPVSSNNQNKRHLQSIQYFNMDGVEGEEDWREFLVISMSDEHNNQANINMVSIGEDNEFGSESKQVERVFHQWLLDKDHFSNRIPNIPRGYNHPGGSQMIGEYLFIALEDFNSNIEYDMERMRPKIGVWKIGRLANQNWAYLDFRYLVDPYYGHPVWFNGYENGDYNEFPPWKLGQGVPKNISTVAVTKLKDKTYLLAACVEAGCKKIYFLKSRIPDQLADDPEFIFIDEWKYDGELLYPDWDERHGEPVENTDYNFWTVCAPQNGNFIVQDDGDIFLTFFGMQLGAYGNCGWGNGTNTIYTYKINFTNEREIKLDLIVTNTLSNQTYVCDPLADIDPFSVFKSKGLNFEAGAGIWIAPNGVTSRISLLATEHYNSCATETKSRWGVTKNWNNLVELPWP
jgi:Dictyostelium (slime mold) repeat